MDDIYIDRQERKVRFLEVGAGGFLGMGEKHFLVPVEAVTEVGEARVTIVSGKEKVVEYPPFDTKVVPPATDNQRDTVRLPQPYRSLPGWRSSGSIFRGRLRSLVIARNH